MNDFLLDTSWFIPFYGLLGAVLSLPWSLGAIRTTGPRPAAYLNLLMTLLAFVHGSTVFWQILDAAPRQIVFPWLQAADLSIPLSLEISPISMGAMELVTAISLLAQLFALGYMEKDWSLARFYGLMGFFEAALGGIAISDSLFLSYALLEMLTLSTYLLVGFWYAQPLVVTAARDAFLTKRVGDILLLMGIVALSSYGAGLSFSELPDWVQASSLTPAVTTLLGLALIAGPIGKCAQFPLHLWLDESMEGPNPASIMRNSVVVSAGGYVLIKLQPVLALSPVVLAALVTVGAVTAVGASLVAIAQIDIKRTLSHSTSAYLGLVFVAVGLGQVDVALMLLFAHAIAKGLLFMSAGSIIATTSGQNITEMGGLWSRMPATTTAFAVGSAGLIALFPSGGFWTLWRWMYDLGYFPWALLLLLGFVNGLSALNLTRVYRLVFLGKPQQKTRRAPEVPWAMALPMVILTVVNLLLPLLMKRMEILPLALGAETSTERAIGSVSLLLLAISGAIGCLLGSVVDLPRRWSRPAQRAARFWQDLLAYDFYVDRLYRLTVVSVVEVSSKLTAWIDRYIVDGLVNLVGLGTILGGQALRYTSSGQSQLYVLTIVLGVGLLCALSLLVLR